MYVIVVLSDCPPKLRGDMTKWFFEINTGVYIGNLSARVRDNLWDRITENIGHGHVTMVYSAPGEQHFDFRVHNAYWNPVDFDGIKLMRRPGIQLSRDNTVIQSERISNASKRLKKSVNLNKKIEYSSFFASSYVVLDFETTGFYPEKDSIIEIGAILVDRGAVSDKIQMFVYCDSIPSEIVDLTGITEDVVKINGLQLKDAVNNLIDFTEDLPFVCHNAMFEQSFWKEACSKVEIKTDNRFIDTLKMAQVLLPDMENHQLSRLADYFNISYHKRHRALVDCEITNEIYIKLKEIAFPDKT